VAQRTIDVVDSPRVSGGQANGRAERQRQAGRAGRIVEAAPGGANRHDHGLAAIAWSGSSLNTQPRLKLASFNHHGRTQLEQRVEGADRPERGDDEEQRGYDPACLFGP
jgi:hypothetical protein